MVGANLGPQHDLARRINKLSQGQMRLDTRDILQNASIGAGGLTVYDGGSIIVKGGGSIQLPTGTFTAAHVVGSSDVTAPTVRGTTVAAGEVDISGLIKSPATYSNPITSSYRAVWVTSVDGQFGYNLSSRQFKQDIAEFEIDPALALKLRAVTFRYIAAVEQHGEDAAREVGLIAEEVDELGLSWLVDYDPDSGRPAGIKFHLLALAALAVAKDHEARLEKLERRARA